MLKHLRKGRSSSPGGFPDLHVIPPVTRAYSAKAINELEFYSRPYPARTGSSARCYWPWLLTGRWPTSGPWRSPDYTEVWGEGGGMKGDSGGVHCLCKVVGVYHGHPERHKLAKRFWENWIIQERTEILGYILKVSFGVFSSLWLVLK